MRQKRAVATYVDDGISDHVLQAPVSQMKHKKNKNKPMQEGTNLVGGMAGLGLGGSLLGSGSGSGSHCDEM